jgi:hypothetical protein
MYSGFRHDIQIASQDTIQVEDGPSYRPPCCISKDMPAARLHNGALGSLTHEDKITSCESDQYLEENLPLRENRR